MSIISNLYNAIPVYSSTDEWYQNVMKDSASHCQHCVQPNMKLPTMFSVLLDSESSELYNNNCVITVRDSGALLGKFDGIRPTSYVADDSFVLKYYNQGATFVLIVKFVDTTTVNLTLMVGLNEYGTSQWVATAVRYGYIVDNHGTSYNRVIPIARLTETAGYSVTFATTVSYSEVTAFTSYVTNVKGVFSSHTVSVTTNLINVTTNTVYTLSNYSSTTIPTSYGELLLITLNTAQDYANAKDDIFYLKFRISNSNISSVMNCVTDIIEFTSDELVQIQYTNESPIRTGTGIMRYGKDNNIVNKMYVRPYYGNILHDWKMEEEVTKRDGFEFVEKRVSYEEHKICFIGFSYQMEALRMIWHSNNITILFRNASYAVQYFTFAKDDTSLQDEMKITITFKTDTITQTNGGGVIASISGGADMTSATDDITTIYTMLESINNTIQQQTVNINSISSAVATKADATTVNAALQLKASTDSVTTLATTVNTISDDVDTLDSSVTSLTTNVNTLNTTTSNLSTAVGTLNTTTTNMNTHLGIIDGKLNTLDTNYTTLNNSMISAVSSISTLTSTVSDVNSNIGTINTSINTLNTSVSRNTTDLSVLKRTFNNKSVSVCEGETCQYVTITF
jgi:archaellum component FlaC